MQLFGVFGGVIGAEPREWQCRCAGWKSDQGAFCHFRSSKHVTMLACLLELQVQHRTEDTAQTEEVEILNMCSRTNVELFKAEQMPFEGKLLRLI